MISLKKQSSERLSLLTLLPEDHRASLRVLPGSDKARKMTAGSGLRLCGPWLPSGRLGACLKILLGSEAWGSMMCFLTWRAWDTPAKRWIFRLQESEPRTGDTGSGLWGTPVANDDNKSPEAHMAMKQRMKGGPRKVPTSLQVQAKMWPTPASRDFRGPKMKPFSERGGGKKGEQLPNAVAHQMHPTPDAGAAKGRGVQSSGDRSRLGGSLNPQWVEWLQGFPEGWTDLEHSETQ